MCHYYNEQVEAEIGDVGVGTFKKLMSALVDSVMLYGVEIWGCTRGLEAIEQVQMRAHVLWGRYLTPKGIIDDGVRISTSSV